MIIAWTVFIITGAISLLLLIASIHDLTTGQADNNSWKIWFSMIIFIIITSVPAQVIFG